jgi:hypothetical protein
VAKEALRDHLQRQMEEMKRLGDLYEDHGLVFTTEVGSSSTQQTFVSGLSQRS